MKLIHGDSLEILKDIPDKSVDLLCTDPPYGYSFMGKSWDKALPDIGIFKECFRVLKPGAFAFVMSAPRSDVCSRMSILLEDAGFNIAFTPIYWTYASGFPKAMNIGKMVDKRDGVYESGLKDGIEGAKRNKVVSDLGGSYGGFQPKPAVEVVIVAMKPISEKTYVDQALKNGKGITWLDNCRVPINDQVNFDVKPNRTKAVYGGNSMLESKTNYINPDYNSSGRFPANLAVNDNVLDEYSRFFSLDAWANNLPFLQVPKAGKSEKGKDNKHPTVKPLRLMSYLITLGSRPGDVVLDPFVGSGTTCIAAEELGRDYIGIEREKEYYETAEARLQAIMPTLQTTK